ncbi:MAG TPA: hypothetical protein VK691_12035 [Solirubrobacteraceae bacterium]|nr:hypothetical protein [Solirubrobacteraceae bacterium]
MVAAGGAEAKTLRFIPRSGTFPQKFSGETGTPRLETSPGRKLVCSGHTKLTGQFNGPTEVTNTVVTFEKCRFEGFAACENSGTEIIKTKTLTGKLGYISKSKEEVGLDFTGEAKTGSEPVWAEFTCSLLGKVSITGHVIGNITKPHLNLPGETEFALSFDETKGVQTPSAFEGGPSGQQLHWIESPNSEVFGIDSEFSSLKIPGPETFELEG